MERINRHLYEEYLFWSRELDEFRTSVGDFGTGIDSVLRAHFLLCDFFLTEGERVATPGPRDKMLFLSALDRQSAGFGDFKKWTDLFHVTATLFFGIIKNHPFYDGNKRTALLVALFQLSSHGWVADKSKKVFETLAVRTAAGELSSYVRYHDFKKKGDPEIRTIAQILRANTRREDRRYVRVTYRDLVRILKKFQFEVEGPNDNKINVVRVETAVKGFFIKKSITKRRLVIQVGCPRITEQINPKALKEILKACELTAENGYDSQVVFGDSDPLDELIGEFQAPLRRLKDK